MAIFSAFTYNYLEDDVGIHTRMSIFKYQRPRPDSKMLKQPLGTIILPYPDHIPPDHYSMDIRSQDLGLMGNLTDIKQAESVASVLQTVKERLGNVNGSNVGAIAALGLGVAPIVSDALGNKLGLTIAETAQATVGVVKNPHTALLFNNVNLRTFQIQWRLSPRSEAQSKRLNSIINTIKRAMHPNLAIGGFALDYPNLVRIDFNNDKEGITKIDYAFIKDFQIDGTPNGHVFYRDGYPSLINMTMTVEEVQIRTAEDFEEYGLSSGSGNNNGLPPGTPGSSGV